MTMFDSPELRLNPWPMFALMRQSSPVYHDEQSDSYSVFRYDDVKTALTEQELFSSEYGDIQQRSTQADQPFVSSIITLDPPAHTRLRALIARAFTPRAVANLEGRIHELAHHLLDQVSETGQIDLVADLSASLPVTVIAEMLGIPSAERVQFKRWSDVVVASASGVVRPDPALAAARDVAMRDMHVYFLQIIQQRRVEPRDDLISALVAAELDGEHLSDEDIFAFCWLLLVAGNETTTNLISNAIITFLEHPDTWARLQADPSLLPSAIEEVLRYRSPVQAMFRFTKRELELAGQTIPARKLILAWIGSANRDEKKFAEPERFDITRSPNPHLAFGNGIHFCLGAPLARLEARVALKAILERLPGLARVDDSPLEPLAALIVHGVTSLPLRFAPARQLKPVSA